MDVDVCGLMLIAVDVCVLMLIDVDVCVLLMLMLLAQTNVSFHDAHGHSSKTKK